MASSETESVELKETVVKLSNNGSQIGSEAVPERGNTALSPNDVKEWSADKLENFLDSKISLVEAEGTTCLLLYVLLGRARFVGLPRCWRVSCFAKHTCI